MCHRDNVWPRSLCFALFKLTFVALKHSSGAFVLPQLPLGPAEISTGRAESWGEGNCCCGGLCAAGGGGFDVGSDSPSLARTPPGLPLHCAVLVISLAYDGKLLYITIFRFLAWNCKNSSEVVVFLARHFVASVWFLKEFNCFLSAHSLATIPTQFGQCRHNILSKTGSLSHRPSSWLSESMFAIRTAVQLIKNHLAPCLSVVTLLYIDQPAILSEWRRFIPVVHSLCFGNLSWILQNVPVVVPILFLTLLLMAKTTFRLLTGPGRWIV